MSARAVPIAFALIALAFIIVIIGFPVSDDSFATSGSCGEEVTYDLTDGVLTISGTGAMDDFSRIVIPWVRQYALYWPVRHVTAAPRP